MKCRGGMKSSIFHVTTNPRHQGRVPIQLLCLEGKKQRDPQGFTSLTVVVSIACPIHIVWNRNPGGSPLKITIKVYYVKSMGIKVRTQQFVLGT